MRFPCGVCAYLRRSHHVKNILVHENEIDCRQSKCCSDSSNFVRSRECPMSVLQKFCMVENLIQ